MTPKTRKITAFLATLLGATGLQSASSFAAGNDAMSFGMVSMAGGIASPGMITSVFENPAALGFADRLKFFNAYTLVPDSGFNDAGYGLQVVPGGPKDVGFSLGLRHVPQNGGITTAHYGLGLQLEGISTALGVSARTPLSPSGSTTFNAGALFNPQGKIRVGVTAFGFNGGVDEWGAGIGTDLSPGVEVGVDGTSDRKFKNRAVAPGIRIGNANASMSVAYGIAVDGDTVHSTQLTDKFSGGVSLMLSRDWVIQALYQRFSKWTLSLSGTF